MAERGLIIGIVAGLAFLFIAVVIGFVVVQNIADVHEDLDTATGTAYVTNESGHLNGTGYTLAGSTATGFISPVITAIWNSSNDEVINIANASIVSGVVYNTSGTYISDAVKFTYYYSYKSGTDAVSDMRNNFTEGIDNVSEKLPTILLVSAVVLIMGVLLLLWYKYKQMGSSGSAEL